MMSLEILGILPPPLFAHWGGGTESLHAVSSQGLPDIYDST